MSRLRPKLTTTDRGSPRERLWRLERREVPDPGEVPDLDVGEELIEAIRPLGREERSCSGQSTVVGPRCAPRPREPRSATEPATVPAPARYQARLLVNAARPRVERGELVEHLRGGVQAGALQWRPEVLEDARTASGCRRRAARRARGVERLVPEPRWASPTGSARRRRAAAARPPARRRIGPRPGRAPCADAAADVIAGDDGRSRSSSSIRRGRCGPGRLALNARARRPGPRWLRSRAGPAPPRQPRPPAAAPGSRDPTAPPASRAAHDRAGRRRRGRRRVGKPSTASLSGTRGVFSRSGRNRRAAPARGWSGRRRPMARSRVREPGSPRGRADV